MEETHTHAKLKEMNSINKFIDEHEEHEVKIRLGLVWCFDCRVRKDYVTEESEEF